MVTACRTCNHRKANRTPLAANMPLLTEPQIPNWLPTVETPILSESIPESWKLYLDPADHSIQEQIARDLTDLTG